MSKTKAPRTIAERVAAANGARDDARGGRKVQLPGARMRRSRGGKPRCGAATSSGKAHRTRAQSIRCVRKLGGAEAVAAARGRGQQHATRSEIAAGARRNARAAAARVEGGSPRRVGR